MKIAMLKAQLPSGLTERQAEAVEADTAEAEHAILAYLRTQTESVEENAIHDAIQARRTTIQRTLRSLVDAGTVRRTGQGKRGDAYRYQVSGSHMDGYQKTRIRKMILDYYR